MVIGKYLPGPFRNSVPVSTVGMVPVMLALAIVLGALPSVVLKVVFR